MATIEKQSRMQSNQNEARIDTFKAKIVKKRSKYENFRLNTTETCAKIRKKVNGEYIFAEYTLLIITAFHINIVKTTKPIPSAIKSH